MLKKYGLSASYYNDLLKTIDYVTQVHTGKLLFSYTDHGIKHSERILSHLEDLIPELFTKYLNEHEQYCLIASIYLHDIGMQMGEDDNKLIEFCKEYKSYKNYKGKKLDYKNFSNNKFESIREYHHLLSKFYINHSKDKYPYCCDPELETPIANICVSHGEDYVNDSKYTKNIEYQGDTIRMGLLCTLLSLGDALDCDNRRINYKELKTAGISEGSKLHWMKHYYMKSITISPNLVKFYYEFPKISNKEISNIYDIYFKNETEYWVHKCKKDAGKYLREVGAYFEIVNDINYDSHKDKLTDNQLKEIENRTIQKIIKRSEYQINRCEYQIVQKAIAIIKNGNKILVYKPKVEDDINGYRFIDVQVNRNQTPDIALDYYLTKILYLSFQSLSFLGSRIHPLTQEICHYYEVKSCSKTDSINLEKTKINDVEWIDVDHIRLPEGSIFYRIVNALK